MTEIKEVEEIITSCKERLKKWFDNESWTEIQDDIVLIDGYPYDLDDLARYLVLKEHPLK